MIEDIRTPSDENIAEDLKAIHKAIRLINAAFSELANKVNEVIEQVNKPEGGSNK